MTYSDTTDCGSKGKRFKKGVQEYKEVEAFPALGKFGRETP